MAFDGLVLSAIANELQNLLVTGRIDKIQQPTEHDLILTIRAERSNYRLLLSANKSFARVHLLSSMRLPNPTNAPMFCMLMRKHLEGGRIRSITQFQRERILFIDIDAYNELGDKVIRRIVVELMGRHSNILLLDQPGGVILDAVTHTSHAINRHREILPGKPYVYPPLQTKKDPFSETKDAFDTARAVAKTISMKRFVIDHYLGIGPFFGDELSDRIERTRASLAQDMPQDLEWQIFSTLLDLARNAKQPTIVRDSWGSAIAFYLFPLSHVDGTAQTYANVNQCVEAFYEERALADIARSKTASYIRLVRTERERALQKIAKFETLLDAHESAEMWRVIGELLTAYAHQVEKGKTSVTLPNFYDDERLLTIELDPAKSALENANAYFKRYAKYKKGREVTLEQLELARADAIYLESVLHELASCQIEDVPDIEAELREVGLLQKNTKTSKQTQQKKGSSRYATYYATDGTPILVGRNNRENDLLTLKIAQKTDIWLHVKDAPGSHVIIRSAAPTETTIYEAALLAGYFSKHKQAGKVEVDVVPVKNIWQPNRAHPGFVLFTGQRTLVVNLEHEVLTKLLMSTNSREVIQ
ncbi:Rqc2 family fibronectin-binding protein [Sulfoacidibacillus thermotolerans]|uniref:Rqc2 homolog RqcH n=1 Tax=Sulfoacidibacillus thermotolerans TaxID=1765684 RepID=A0A2U3D7T6_SULT2|nr:NFACT RNA binding domain-containing protein [Sulfoacidibacillus thermotolerans]PWI57331.1 hypothetical protein BM613_09005 [Sulfoacidibacillus thermotolerans]